jgi:Flp pilus assembly protein TadD
MRLPLEWKLAAILAAATVLVFWPVATHGFVSFDDGLYILDNPKVLAGLTWQGLGWALTSREYASFYHPLTWLSHMLDVELYGTTGTVLGMPAAGWHHLTALCLHLGNALLLFALLRCSTGSIWRSWFVSALFALHPLHVESVAWAAERKDVLSTLFGFACLLAYVRYAARPSRLRYALVASLLIGGLLAKPMLVTWPFVMLLLDWWPLRRVSVLGPDHPDGRRDAAAGTSMPPCFPPKRPGLLILEKVPFLVVVAGFAVLAYVAERHLAMSLMDRLSLGTRLANAAVSVLLYVGKTLWPMNLAPFYPYRALPPVMVVAAVAFLAMTTTFALRTARRRPYLCVGWLWFLGTLVPVSGLVQVGLHAMADRYTYVPLVGLFIAAVWGLAELRIRSARLGRLLPLAAAAVVVASAVATARQVRYWRDSVTLFEHTCDVSPDSGWSHRMLGTALAAAGRNEEAVSRFQIALSQWPEDPIAHNNLGHSLADLGRDAEAEQAYRQAVRFAPDDVTYLVNLGTLLARRGDLQGSLTPLEEAVRLAPEYVPAHIHLGKSLAMLGRMEEAASHFAAATQLEPGNVAAWNNLAAAQAATGRYDAAVQAAAAALRAAETSGSDARVAMLRQRLKEYQERAGPAAGPAKR